MSLDKNNDNTLWSDTIANGMHYVQVAFDTREKGDTPLPGHQLIKCHMISDMKMEDLRCKVRMVDGGHMTDVPLIIKYASFVYCETVMIDLTMEALNNTSVKTYETMNN